MSTVLTKPVSILVVLDFALKQQTGADAVATIRVSILVVLDFALKLVSKTSRAKPITTFQSLLFWILL